MSPADELIPTLRIETDCHCDACVHTIAHAIGSELLQRINQILLTEKAPAGTRLYCCLIIEDHPKTKQARA